MSRRTQLVLFILAALVIAAVAYGLAADRDNPGEQATEQFRDEFREAKGLD